MFICAHRSPIARGLARRGLGKPSGSRPRLGGSASVDAFAGSELSTHRRHRDECLLIRHRYDSLQQLLNTTTVHPASSRPRLGESANVNDNDNHNDNSNSNDNKSNTNKY